MYRIEVYYSDKKVEDYSGLTEEKARRVAYKYGIRDFDFFKEIKEQKTVRPNKTDKLVIIKEKQD